MQGNKKLENLVKLFGMQEVNSRTRGGGSTTTNLCQSRNLLIFFADTGHDVAGFLNIVEKNLVLYTHEEYYEHWEVARMRKYGDWCSEED